MKRWKICIGIAAVVLAAGMVFGIVTWRQQSRYQLTAKNSYHITDSYHYRDYQGKRYQYNNLITTVLVAGIDSEGEMLAYRTYGVAPRSDSIQLVVLDKKTNQITVIALNRDTMTPVRSFNSAGKSLGVFENYLSLAFGFGNGGKSSCENLCEAVSTMLGGIPINEYIIGNISTLPWVNHLVNGVTVTVPNDDLVEIDPTFTKGNTVTLEDEMVERYLRSRDIQVAFSNLGRTQRQQSFITAFVTQLQNRLQNDLEGVWTEAQKVDDYIQTSITRNQYLNLANLVSKMSFEEMNYYQPAGDYKEGLQHDEYYVDQEALQEKVIELFYN